MAASIRRRTSSLRCSLAVAVFSLGTGAILASTSATSQLFSADCSSLYRHGRPYDSQIHRGVPALLYDSVVSEAGNVGEWPEDWLRLNAVCPYYTMFPLDFPLGQLRLYPDARRVLDPFCGRGTTLYAARLTGRQAVGIDINPVAVAIARAKTVQASAAAVVR